MTYVTNNASTRCACSIEEMKFTPAHLVRNPQEKEDAQLTRYLFLLGFPFSGTSAVHFLLGTSANVSTLGNPNILGPTKEGWHIAGTKEEYEDRWDPSGPRPKSGKRISWDAFPWSRISEVYEIMHADRLNATFSPQGKVRFILLVRSACSKGDVTADQWMKMAVTWRSIIESFGGDVFVLRYEDLCYSWPKTLRRLSLWEPRLADVNIDRVPWKNSRRRLHNHDPVSIAKYCAFKTIQWKNASMKSPCLPCSCASRRQPEDKSLCGLSTYFGYAQIDSAACS